MPVTKQAFRAVYTAALTKPEQLAVQGHRPRTGDEDPSWPAGHVLLAPGTRAAAGPPRGLLVSRFTQYNLPT